MSTEKEAWETRVIIRGELDLATAPQLVKHLRRAERGSPKMLLIDLGGVTFMDVAGLSAMLSAARRAARAGRTMRVVRASPPIRRLFELTAIDQTLELVPDRAG